MDWTFCVSRFVLWAIFILFLHELHPDEVWILFCPVTFFALNLRVSFCGFEMGSSIFINIWIPLILILLYHPLCSGCESNIECEDCFEANYRYFQTKVGFGCAPRVLRYMVARMIYTKFDCKYILKKTQNVDTRIVILRFGLKFFFLLI